MKRGREYHGYGEEHNVEKRERGSNSIIIFLIVMRLLGRMAVGKRGSGQKCRGRKSRFKKKLRWGRI